MKFFGESAPLPGAVYLAGYAARSQPIDANSYTCAREGCANTFVRSGVGQGRRLYCDEHRGVPWSPRKKVKKPGYYVGTQDECFAALGSGIPAGTPLVADVKVARQLANQAELPHSILRVNLDDFHTEETARFIYPRFERFLTTQIDIPPESIVYSRRTEPVHGTIAMYRSRKCKCAPCRKAWVLYCRGRKVRKPKAGPSSDRLTTDHRRARKSRKDTTRPRYLPEKRRVPISEQRVVDKFPDTKDENIYWRVMDEYEPDYAPPEGIVYKTREPDPVLENQTKETMVWRSRLYDPTWVDDDLFLDIAHLEVSEIRDAMMYGVPSQLPRVSQAERDAILRSYVKPPKSSYMKPPKPALVEKRVHLEQVMAEYAERLYNDPEFRAREEGYFLSDRNGSLPSVTIDWTQVAALEEA